MNTSTQAERDAVQLGYQEIQASVKALDAMFLPHVEVAIGRCCAVRKPQPLPREERRLLLLECPFRIAFILAETGLSGSVKRKRILETVREAYGLGIRGEPVPKAEIERVMRRNAKRAAADVSGRWIDALATLAASSIDPAVTAEDLAGGQYDDEFFPVGHGWLKDHFLDSIRRLLAYRDVSLMTLTLARAARPAGSVFPPEALPWLRKRIASKRKEYRQQRRVPRRAL